MSHLAVRLYLSVALSLVLVLLLVGASAFGVLTTPRVEARSTPAAFVFLPPAPIFSDDFNDNSLGAAKWTPNELFSGFSDLNLPISATSQRLAIGPLAQNTSGSHYRGVRSINTFDFTGGAASVELVQAASSATAGDAMFTIGYSVEAYYRFYVSGGVLRGQRKVGATKAPLFSASYDPGPDRFLRIRQNSTTGNVILETA